MQTADASPVPVTLTVGANNQNTSFAGTLTGSGALVKVGSGTLTVSGPGAYSSTFAGGATVQSGTLALGALSGSSNQFGTGTITLSGGTLALPAVTFAPGLKEGYIDNLGGDTNTLTAASAVTWMPGTVLFPRAGYTTQKLATGTPPNATTPWGDYRQIVYSGQFDWVPQNGAAGPTFAWSIDNNCQVFIQNNGQWIDWDGNPWYGSGTHALTPGWHNIQIQFYNGTGGVGPSGNGFNAGVPNLSQMPAGFQQMGFGYDPTGAAYTSVAQLLPLLETGTSTPILLQSPASTTFSNPLAVTTESTIQIPATGNATPFTFPSLMIGDQTLHITAGQAGGGLTISGATTLNGSVATTFDVQGANTLALAGNMTASGGATSPVGIVKTSSGTLVLGGAANLYSGGTTIGLADGTFGGTLAAGGSDSLGSGGVLINNGTLDIQNGYNETRQITLAHVNSTIGVDAGTYTPTPLVFTNGGYLTKTGAGILAITPSLVTGVQNVTAGGGSINLGGNTLAINNLTLGGGSVNNGVVNVAAGIAAQSGSAGAQLTGSAGLVKSTPGTVQLTAVNSYTGGTTVSQGTLQVFGSGQLPSGGITLSGGTLSFAPLAAGLTSTYYGGQGNGITLNATYGVSPNNYDINNLNLAQFNAAVATLPVGLVTNTTVKGGPTGSFFVGQNSGYLDAPYNNDGADNFIASYTGYFYAPVAGNYQFQAGGDNRGELWLDNSDAERIYNGGTNTFYLTAGSHPITIGFEEYGGGQNIYANVQGPAGSGLESNQNIPNSVLSSPPPTVTYNNDVTVTASSTLDLTGTGTAYLAP